MAEGLRACAALGLCCALALAVPAASAQKIVCWKDKSGRVAGCGDRVPPEYQLNESRVLDNQGITRKTNVSAEESARLKEEAARRSVQKAEEARKTAEQRRLDSVLINTYTSEREIDQRRDRELQGLDLQIQQLAALLKKAVDAEERVRQRLESARKGGEPPAALTDEMARAGSERKGIEARIGQKQTDREEINTRYAGHKARFIELGAAAAIAPAPAAKK